MKQIHVAAARGLMPPQNSFMVKFPLPDPKDPFSLKPGSVPCTVQDNKALEIEQVTSLTAAIAGAKAAATQFSKKGQSLQTDNTYDYTTRSKSKASEEDAKSLDNPGLGSGDRTYTTRSMNKRAQVDEEGYSGSSSKGEYDTKLTVKHNVESNKRSVVTKKEDRNTSIGERRFDPGPARVCIFLTL